MKYRIYKLIYEDNVVYVGQTTLSLQRRKNGYYGKNTKFFKLCDMELIEETDDISRERHWIEYYRNLGEPLLNKVKGSTGLNKEKYSKKYYEDNKQHIKEYAKNNYKENKEHFKEYLKEYLKLNKRDDNYKKYQSEYYQKNKEKAREYYKKYNRNKNA